MIGGKNSGQKNGEQAGQPEQHAVHELAVADLQFVVEGLPQIDARKPFRGKLGNVGDGLAGLERDAENIGAVVFDPLRHESQRGGHGLQPSRIKVGPDGA